MITWFTELPRARFAIFGGFSTQILLVNSFFNTLSNTERFTTSNYYMKKTIVRRSLPSQVLVEADDLHPVLRRVYVARGIQTKEELERDLAKLLPYQDLLGIEAAVSCLADALASQKHILIIGDFDTDGATSSALAVSALKALGGQQIGFLVPNRFEYGYGLTPEIVEVAIKLDPQVIVTVDNGISSHAGVDAANAAGIKVVITDHHLPGVDLPKATAIVNPQQKGDKFLSKNLAGVGVIFYVMLALRTELRNRNWFSEQGIAEPNMAQFLDLVALGTVADLVPLDRNNRILVHQGMQRIRAGKARAGIAALLTVAGKQANRMVASDLGFFIGPRLNAAGRLSDMSLGIECLLTEDLNRARELATQLSVLNEERRLIERDMKEHAWLELNKLQQLNNKEGLPLGVCLFDEQWHQGIIGLLASRVKDHVHRPTIIFAPGNSTEELKGSARSISGLHIRDVLAAVDTHHPGLITRFGGHAMAAGLTLPRASYSQFQQAFATEVANHLDLANLKAELYSDGELSPLDFCLPLAEQLRAAGPWGQAFPEPIFDGNFKVLQQKIVGGKHLKLTLVPRDSSLQLDAIAFNIDVESWPNHRATHIHAAYKLDINEYLGRLSLQLIVEQLEPV